MKLAFPRFSDNAAYVLTVINQAVYTTSKICMEGLHCDCKIRRVRRRRVAFFGGKKKRKLIRKAVFKQPWWLIPVIPVLLGAGDRRIVNVL